jgi:hypothetical protein
VAISIDGWEGVESVDRPGESPTGDYCSVCGKELVYAGRGKHPTKCEDHKAGSTAGTSTRGNRSSAKGGASRAEWEDFNTVALISITWLIGRFAAGGQGLFLRPPPTMTDEELTSLSDYLSMDAEEAQPIAKLLAGHIAPTSFNKRFGKHVVKALEYEEVGGALWEYGKRVGPVLQSRLAKKPAQSPKIQVAKTTPPPTQAPKPTTKAQAQKGSTTNGAQRPLSNAEVVRAARLRQLAEQGSTTSNGGDAGAT